MLMTSNESARDNFGKFIYQRQPKPKTLVRKLERILIRLWRPYVSLSFNQTNLNEGLLLILSLSLSLYIYIYIYIYCPAVRVFANGPGDLGSIPGRVIPKTLKMELDTTLLNTQHYKVRFKGKVEQSREWSSALPYTLV